MKKVFDYILLASILSLATLFALALADYLYTRDLLQGITAQSEDDMETYFYLAPIVDQHANNPDIDRVSWVSKVRLYLTGDESHSSVQMANPYKMWTLSIVRAAPSTHAAIQTDAQITLVPLWDSTDVDTRVYLSISATVAEIDPVYRAQIATFLEARRVPAGWIQGFHTIGRVFRYTGQILQITDLLLENYPEVDLNLQVSDIPAQQRTRIEQWMRNHGIETVDIVPTWTIRQVLQRIVDQYPWMPFFKFGGELL
jgi:hypothetical protein